MIVRDTRWLFEAPIGCLNLPARGRSDDVSVRRQATVKFGEFIPLRQAINHPKAKGQGVYSIFFKREDGSLRPWYIGKSEGQTGIAERLQRHAKHLRFSGRDLDRFVVQWAPIKRVKDKAANDKRLAFIEHSLIVRANNYLARKGLPLMKNERSTKPFRVDHRSTVTVRGSKIPTFRRPIKSRKGVVRERETVPYF